MKTSPKGASGSVKYSTRGPVAHVKICRPEKANAYHGGMLDALDAARERFEADEALRVLVVCGEGDRAFCAGADLGALRGRGYRDALDLQSARVFTALAACPKVTMAAINGAAVAGGLELALACDLRLAAAHARFRFPETGLGLIPAAGGTGRLPRIVGEGRAKELILGGCEWSAEDALRAGLVTEVVRSDLLLDRAQAWAEKIAQRDPLASRLAKNAIDRSRPDGLDCSFARVAEALLYQIRSPSPSLRGKRLAATSAQKRTRRP